MTQDFSKISLRLSGAVEFWRVCGHDGPEFDPGQEHVLILQLL